ncbi:MAG: DUF86 domain-containing protein [Candidatus Sumerlaeota bacterium]|nr:DUF86 domain-containing protein [Candidatus Sumerlaeota bacterium]
MRAETGDASYIWDMLDAARAVCEFVSGRTFDEYLRNRMLRGAVERHIEIIGEAAHNVSRGFQNVHSEIPWRKVIAQRNVLAHEYGEIKHERIWALATIHLPVLIAQLEPLLRQPPPHGSV